MTIVRCVTCGQEIDIRYVDNKNEYHEVLSDSPCRECRKSYENPTPEIRLLTAIFGERIA